MVKRYYSGILSATRPVPTNTSASGLWGLTDAVQATTTNTWPLSGSVTPDILVEIGRAHV